MWWLHFLGPNADPELGGQSVNQNLATRVRKNSVGESQNMFVLAPVLRIHIRMFLGLLDPDPLVRGTDLDSDPSIIKQK
jgi:hypothetical protein